MIHLYIAKSLQSCPTLCEPRDGSPPGSPVPGILQARTMEWGAIVFSVTNTYIYIYISLSDYFPLNVITKYLVEFTVLYSRSLWILYLFRCLFVYLVAPGRSCGAWDL